jgi:hypothetical protein
MVVQRGVGLGGHGLNPRQAGEQLVVGLLGRRAELRRRLAPLRRRLRREDLTYGMYGQAGDGW